MIDKAAPASILFIGGLGGSGTRAVAGAVAALGYYPGGCLNASNDNLIFTELFKRPDWLRRNPPASAIHGRLALFESVMTGGVRWQHLLRAPGLRAFRRDQGRGLAGAPGNIGWMTKEPNCHIFLEPILERWDRAVFVYVSRHPLDMAFSDNKGQLGNWSWLFDLDPTTWPSPEAAQLEYWIRTQRRLDALTARHPGRVHPLLFDVFAARPAEERGRRRSSAVWSRPSAGPSRRTGSRPPAPTYSSPPAWAAGEIATSRCSRPSRSPSARTPGGRSSGTATVDQKSVHRCAFYSMPMHRASSKLETRRRRRTPPLRFQTILGNPRTASQ